MIKTCVCSIGDKPGWKKPVLIINGADETLQIPITRKQVEQLERLGLPKQG